MITSVTSPSAVALSIAAGETKTEDIAFTNNKTDWTSGACASVTISGDNSAWVTLADGVATIAVPETAEAGDTTITFTYAGSDTNAVSGSGNSTATGTVDVVLTVTGGSGGPGGSSR